MRHFLLTSLLLVCVGTVRAQVVCVTMPSDSPVLAPDIDDIPATDVDIITYTGSYAKARANHNLAFVQINDNDQRVWFGPDADPGLHRCFYNRRYRADASSPWYWQYSVSPKVIDFPSPSSAGPSSVLYSATPKYRDIVTGTLYKFMMIQNVQPGTCDGAVLGFMHVAFSDDGICWTAAQQSWQTSGPSFACWPGHSSTVPIEQAAAIDAGDKIFVIGLEGDSEQLVPTKCANGQAYPSANCSQSSHQSFVSSQMNRTQTYIGWLDPTNPAFVNRLTSGELTKANMFIANFVDAPYNQDRFWPYNYMMNMSVAYDPAAGDFYIGRAYPYPFDRGTRYGSPQEPQAYGTVTPLPQYQPAVKLWDSLRGYSNVGGCYGPPATLPNRIQIYKMHIGALTVENVATLTSYGWTFVGDYGGSGGYGNQFQYVVTQSTPLKWFQTDSGRDIGAVSFIRDGQGNLVRQSGLGLILAADTFKLNKSAGPCNITGLERETLMTIP